MDPDAARVRAQAAGIRVFSTSMALLFRTNFLLSNSDLDEGNRQAVLIEKIVQGNQAAVPVPDVLRSLKLVPPESIKRDLSTPWGTAARTVEASYLNAIEDPRPVEQALVLLYLQGIAEVQEDAPADTVDGTLKFIIKHWDAGDQGCARQYRKHRETANFEADDWVAMARDL